MATESMKYLGATWLFARSIVRGLNEYFTTSTDKIAPPGVRDWKPLPEKLPSITDIKKVIPKHCFEAEVSTSMYYALKDAVMVAITFILINFVHRIENPWIWWPALFSYWVVQGVLFTAIFIIGHDCGHGSFSRHPLLNDTIGTIYHTFLLAPYYMWKVSHSTHHKNNANIDQDEVYFPIRRSQINEDRHYNKVPPLFGFGVGWYAYIIKGYHPRAVPHFDIVHHTFHGHFTGCLISLVSWIFWASCLYWYGSNYGFASLFNYWMVPDFIFASFCVIITFLHHSELNIPWYSDDNWDFVKGQLSTVDRHYGVIHTALHSIGTHQMHHMFSRIPHYHLEEATSHFRAAFPELVHSSEEPILTAFMRMFRKYESQSIIEDDTRVHLYK